MSDLVKRLMSDHPGDDMREVYFSDEAPNFNIDPFNGDTSCGKCGGCGAWLTVVRPGKAQCDFCEGDYDAATRWAAAARIEELEAARDCMGNLWAKEEARAEAAEAKLATARNDALEEAARACADLNGGWSSDAHLECVEVIRAMKSTNQT